MYYMYFDDVNQYNQEAIYESGYFPLQQNVTGPFIDPQFRQDLTDTNNDFTQFLPQTSGNGEVANILSTNR